MPFTFIVPLRPSPLRSWAFVPPDDNRLAPVLHDIRHQVTVTTSCAATLDYGAR